MPTAREERPWTDADREPVAGVLRTYVGDHDWTPHACDAVLDALTAAGWRPPPRMADPSCQVPDGHGRPVCVRTIAQQPCATCPAAPEEAT